MKYSDVVNSKNKDLRFVVELRSGEIVDAEIGYSSLFEEWNLLREKEIDGKYYVINENDIVSIKLPDSGEKILERNSKGEWDSVKAHWWLVSYVYFDKDCGQQGYGNFTQMTASNTFGYNQLDYARKQASELVGTAIALTSISYLGEMTKQEAVGD